MLKLNNLFNICIFKKMIYMYSIHIQNADIVLICVYMYNIYTVFLLLFITVKKNNNIQYLYSAL